MVSSCNEGTQVTKIDTGKEDEQKSQKKERVSKNQKDSEKKRREWDEKKWEGYGKMGKRVMCSLRNEVIR